MEGKTSSLWSCHDMVTQWEGVSDGNFNTRRVVGAMEGMASALWSSHDMTMGYGSDQTCQGLGELDQRLLLAAIEIKTAQTEAEERVRRNEERINQLLHLLQIACQQRDEAREKLILLSSLSPQPGQAAAAHCLSGSPSPFPSGTSDGPSDVISSPDLPGSDLDRADAVIDQMVRDRPLPRRGRLVEAIAEAAPLMQTLLVAGSLPRWRNPPPLQRLQMPPPTSMGLDPTGMVLARKRTAESGCYVGGKRQRCEPV